MNPDLSVKEGVRGLVSKMTLEEKISQTMHDCPAGHITVRLQVPPTHNVPSAGFHQFPYPLEKHRIILLNPLIKYDFVMVENERSIFFT